MFKPTAQQVAGMPTKSTSMAPEDDDVSISSGSSSSEGSQASVEESLKDPAEDRCDRCWRQSAFCGIVFLAAIVIFTISVLMINQDSDEFATSVSALSGAEASSCVTMYSLLSTYSLRLS
jgi:hypothetical protein